MAFSFGFSGDDIDMEDSEINTGVPDVLPPKNTTNSLPELVKPKKHDINDWVSECGKYFNSIFRVILSVVSVWEALVSGSSPYWEILFYGRL